MKKIITITAVCALVAICALALFACAPNSSSEKAVESLSNNKYSAYEDNTIIPIALRLLGVKGIDKVVVGSYSDDDNDESIVIIYFDTADYAKQYNEAIIDYASEHGYKNDDENWVFARSGKMIWYGTKNAVKAAR